MNDSTKYHVFIDVEKYLLDHHFRGQAVLPAVSAVRLLADSVASAFPTHDIRTTGSAEFFRFLPLTEEGSVVDTEVELSCLDDGGVCADLNTLLYVKKLRITREKSHVSILFPDRSLSSNMLRCPPVKDQDSEETIVTVEELYSQRVPFGKAFQNVISPVNVRKSVVTCQVQSPSSDGFHEMLGSPFPMDAAFHAACAWGQIHKGFTAFPFGYEFHQVQRPVQPGETCQCLIIPQTHKDKTLLFDVYLQAMDGELCEVMWGLKMKEISGI